MGASNRSIGWTMSASASKRPPLRAELLSRLQDAIPAGTTIKTLAQAKPNLVESWSVDGAWVITERTKELGRSAELVPGWMIETAWRYLADNKSMTQRYLLNELNVKRSAAVCALLAMLDDVEIVSTMPITLRICSAP